MTHCYTTHRAKDGEAANGVRARRRGVIAKLTDAPYENRRSTYWRFKCVRNKGS